MKSTSALALLLIVLASCSEKASAPDPGATDTAAKELQANLEAEASRADPQAVNSGAAAAINQASLLDAARN